MGQDTPPTITVVIPVYNGAAFLPQALESVSNQTFKDWECIVVDDGSTDLSYNIARAFGKRDSRIWVIRLEQNGGAPRAFNAGLARAQGKYVAHLAADDYLLDDFLAECVKVLERDQTCSAVYTDFIEWEAPWKRVRRLPDFEYERLLREDYVNFSAFVSRSSMWLDPHWEPVSDWHTVIETARHGPLVHIPEMLSVRRIHAGQVSVQRRWDMVVKSFLLAFHYSPRAGLWRLGQALTWPVWKVVRS